MTDQAFVIVRRRDTGKLSWFGPFDIDTAKYEVRAWTTERTDARYLSISAAWNAGLAPARSQEG